MKYATGVLTLFLILIVGCLITTALAMPQSEEKVTIPSRTIEGKIVTVLITTIYEETAYPEGLTDEYYFLKDSTGAEFILHKTLPADQRGKFLIGDRIQAEVSVYGEVLSIRHAKFKKNLGNARAKLSEP